MYDGNISTAVTFHRAFDMTRDPVAAFETIAELGFSRVLTSGQEKTAHEGRCATTLYSLAISW